MLDSAADCARRSATPIGQASRPPPVSSIPFVGNEKLLSSVGMMAREVEKVDNHPGMPDFRAARGVGDPVRPCG